VIHSYNKIRNELKTDSVLTQEIEQLRAILWLTLLIGCGLVVRKQ
jgi:hypothetical protein